MDADDYVDAIQEQLEAATLAAKGMSVSNIALFKKQKIFREQASMYSFFESTQDPIVSAEEIGVNLAVAYDNLGKRHLAIQALLRARQRSTNNSILTLFLAKLYFRDNNKSEAERILMPFIEAYIKQVTNNKSEIENDTLIREEDAADAFYVLGWIKIHADDHTSAYKIWTRGYEYISTDQRLVRQYHKVQCWHNINHISDWIQENDPYIGKGHHVDGKFDIHRDFDAFAISPPTPEPAAGLFHSSQNTRLIFRTKKPVLTAVECGAVIDAAELVMSKRSSGKWGSVRSASLPTTDVAVEDIPALRGWLRCLVANVLMPLISTCYPVLADGSFMGEYGSRLRIHDAFIVRYDAVEDMSTSLPEHSDTSAVSFTIALNSQSNGDSSEGDNPGITYKGGGTWFKALRTESNPEGGGIVEADIGQAVAFAGPLRHGGHPISMGTRYILVLFMYIEDFPYQQYLINPCFGEELPPTTSGDSESIEKREYVVYKETLDLMTTLNKDFID